MSVKSNRIYCFLVSGERRQFGYTLQDDDMFHQIRMSCSISLHESLDYNVSQEDIEKFLREEQENKEEIEKRYNKEKALLELCGLSESDFSRFRNVYKAQKKDWIDDSSSEENILVVETRENGTNTRSVGALKNKNYFSSYADVGDRTYEYYLFEIPKEIEDDWSCQL